MDFDKYKITADECNKLCLSDRRLLGYKKRDQFRADLEAKFETTDWRQSAKNKMWGYAWREGHASGYHEVYLIYSDLVDIVAEAV